MSACATKEAAMMGRGLEKAMETNKVLQNEVSILEDQLSETHKKDP